MTFSKIALFIFSKVLGLLALFLIKVTKKSLLTSRSAFNCSSECVF